MPRTSDSAGAADPERAPAPVPSEVESTRALLDQIRGGDELARDRLIRRFLPGLRRWAHGRLPAQARGMVETGDLVQVALLRALDRVDLFEAGRGGAFLSYLHQILLNLIRDEARRALRRPAEPLPEELPATREGLLERTVGRGAVLAYERALELLNEDQRQAVILRIEFGFSYPEIAEALGRSSANGVRMQVTRALVQIAKAMHAFRSS